ncbi:hypothetical protein Aperf_G00000110256 [Anoplocephala perfoliata]
MTHRSKSNEPLSVLVLVKERITTAAVARLITEISESTPLYAGLKASHCVSASLTKNVASMSTGEQLDALEGFRANRFNVLVATTVVEEGLDVRACNVVIKADELTNFRSFIQSQGRARAKVSYFVLMTEDKHKCRLTVDRFLEMERRIGDSIEGRCIDSSDEEEEEENYDDVTEIAKTSYMPYGINGPRITASGAASVLMRYIGLLKTDTSYTLKILYSVRKEFGGYQVKMLMPPPSPLQEIITGPCASSKDLAKQLNYCNQHNETLSYKVLGDMLEAIIGAVFIDCGGVTSIVTGVIYNLLQKEIEAYGKKIPVDPVRLMYEEYPGMEITLEKFDKNGPRVRVTAKFKDHIITGEGKNTRTAKLDLAQQLGINIC